MNKLLPPMQMLEWIKLRTHLTWIYEGAPILRKSNHYITGLSGWLLLRGRLRLAVEPDAPIHVGAGSWVFLAPGQVTHQFSDDAWIMSVRFEAQWAEGHNLFETHQPQMLSASRFPRLEKSARPMLKLVSDRAHSGRRDLPYHMLDLRTFLRLQRRMLDWVEAYTDAMIQAGAQPTRPTDPHDRAFQARQMIDQQPLHERTSEKTIAAKVGISISQLNRLFVAEEGVTPRQYAERRRLDFAVQSLRSSSIPVKQMAFALGFKQPSHFSNWFRRHTGYYPRDFRQRMEGPG